MRSARAMLLSFMLGCGSLPAFGQSDVIKPGDERFTIFLGTFISAFDTKLRVDNTAVGQGSSISLANNLGVDQDQSSVLLGVEWRIARHRDQLQPLQPDRQPHGVAGTPDRR